MANAAPSSGGAVTISGLSFGTAGPTATASLTTADACGSSAWTSATTAACAPQAYGGSGVARAAVSVSGVVGTLTGQFSFDGAPQSTALHCAALLSAAARRGMERLCCSAGCEHDFVHFGQPCAERRRRSHDQRAELRHGRPDSDGLADDGGRVRQQRLDVGDDGGLCAASLRRLECGADCGECERSGWHPDGAVQLRWCAQR
jgi:hypothetical protein